MSPVEFILVSAYIFAVRYHLARTSLPLPPPSLFPALRAHRALSPHTASLVPAIVFHPLFEGLSLGIRIAGLPDKHYGASGRVRSGGAQTARAR